MVTWAIVGGCLLVAAPSLPAAASAPARPYVVVYDTQPRETFPVQSETAARERRYGFTSERRFRHAIDGFAARLTAGEARALRADPEVALVAPDRPLRAARMPLAAGETVPAGVARIRAAGAAGVHGASAAAVAVLDTGIDLGHPDLVARAGPNCVGSGPPEDDDGHGTQVAGVIGARNDGNGLVGVAPGTEVYAVKVLDSAGYGTPAQIICGIDWLVHHGPALGIRVVNMSFSQIHPGSTCDSDPLHLAVCRGAQAGFVFTAAAGNNGGDVAATIPGSYPEVLTATAVADTDGAPGGAGPAPCEWGAGEVDDSFASFSNFAVQPAEVAHTVGAPGVCIDSTMRPGDAPVGTGTSFAAPHVAGVVALCMGEPGRHGACSDMTSAQVIEQIRADAAAQASPANGFLGDPFTPVDGRLYGHLVSAHDPTVRRIALPSPPAAAAPSPSPAPADSRVAVLLLRVARRQDVDHLSVTIRLAEAGKVTARARVRVRRAGPRIRSRRATAEAAAGETVRLRLRFSRTGLRRLKRGLRREGRVQARVTVKFTDAAANSRTTKRRVKLRR
jgi:hypothetical protein